MSKHDLMTVSERPDTRGAFLRKAGIGGAALVGGGALLGASAGTARAGHDNPAAITDVDVLNFALTLEFLETAFYRSAEGLSGEAAALARTFGDEEAEHVAALTKAIEGLGGTPAKKPTASFPKGDQAAFLKLAQTLEDTGVSAYNGAAPKIQSKEVLATAGTIVQVEARHAASIRMLNGEDPAPVAFDRTMKQEQVLRAVEPFIRA